MRGWENLLIAPRIDCISAPTQNVSNWREVAVVASLQMILSADGKSSAEWGTRRCRPFVRARPARGNELGHPNRTGILAHRYELKQRTQITIRSTSSSVITSAVRS